MRKFSGQGSNLCHSSDLSHSNDSVGSLTARPLELPSTCLMSKGTAVRRLSLLTHFPAGTTEADGALGPWLGPEDGTLDHALFPFRSAQAPQGIQAIVFSAA